MRNHTILFLCLAFFLGYGESRALGGNTERVSVSSAGAQGNSHSTYLSMSADGRYVVFESSASNLVVNDSNSSIDIFLRDRQTAQTTRISLDSAGTQANNHSDDPVISDDGRFVAFYSYASNLVAGDTNNSIDVFLRDRQSGQTSRVSVGAGGAQANADSYFPVMSADGRLIAFESGASNLAPGDSNNSADVFVRDTGSSQTTRVSVGSGGIQANSASGSPAISTDGRYVAFVSFASNLVPADTNGAADVFVRDRQSSQTTRITQNSGGVAANGESRLPAVSADGRFVAFESDATNLVSGDTNNSTDVFVHDRQTGQTTRVSVNSGGIQADASSMRPALSADGRYVAYFSDATNLVANDSNGTRDVFVHDRLMVFTRRISVATTGVQAGAATGSPDLAMSANGRYVSFDSFTSNLVPGDTNSASDVFLRDRGDVDGDAAFDDEDNCAGIPNPDQQDCNSNSVGDPCDVAGGTSLDIDSNGIPDECLRIWYVNANLGTGANDGTSWANAFTGLLGLQQALAAAQPGNEVWVAAGVYKPAGPGARGVSFQLLSGVALYGGFVGNETALDEREIGSNGLMNHETTLSGDIDGTDLPNWTNFENNSIHVVNGTGTDSSATLEGFTIRSGNALTVGGGGTVLSRGAGLFNEPGSPTVRRCLFTENYAQSGGAGMSNADGAHPEVSDCAFVHNGSNDDGAGMLNRSCSATVTRCVFDSNVGNITDPNNGGGGMANYSSTVTLTACVFISNASSATRGGGLFNASSQASLTRCTFENNTCSEGGAIFHSGGTLAVGDSVFRSNYTSPGGGGAIFDEGGDLLVTGCTFDGNESDSGAGALLTNKTSGMATIEACRFSNNRANLVFPGHGGAVLISTIRGAVIKNCIFDSNTLLVPGEIGGGAVAVQQAAVLTIDRSRFLNNASANDGGALNLHNGSSVEVFNCEFTGNTAAQHGGAVNLRINEQFGPSSANFVNCTFWRNTATHGGAIHNDLGTVVVTNSVLWGNSSPQWHKSDQGVANILNYSDVQGLDENQGCVCNASGAGCDAFCGLGPLTVGPGNIDADPQFVDTIGTDGIAGDDDDDLQLQDSSPCIDAGYNGPGTAAHWTFDEGSGITAEDSSGNGLDGTLVGSVTWGQGRFGTGLQFDTTPDYVEIAHATPLAMSTFTLSFWINAPSQQSGGDGYFAVMDKGHGLAVDGWVLQNVNDSGGAFYLAVGAGSSYYTVTASGVLDDEWHHVAFTVTDVPSIQLRSFVDGIPQNALNGPAQPLLMNTIPLRFGTWWSGSFVREFEGMLDEVRFYDFVLSAEEIARLAAGMTDLGGNDRLVDTPWANGTTPVIDMGAYEHQPDCDSNGVRDDIDIGSNGALDCNSDAILDECEIAAGSAFDCNSNGAPDACDLVSGAYEDCDSNGVPDDCQLAAGIAFDCNSNGTLDICDAADATSVDCNLNTVPDECELAQPIVGVTWVGGVGKWNTAANWCPAVVPNDGGGRIYDAIVSGPAAVVTLDISPEVRSLKCTNGATIEVNSSSISQSLTSLDPIDNAGGRLRARDTRVLTFGPTVTILGGVLEAAGGSSRVLLDGATGANVSLITTNGGEVQGQHGGKLVDPTIQTVEIVDGNVFYMQGRVQNDQRILVNSLTRPTTLRPTLDLPEVRVTGAGRISLSVDPSKALSRASIGDPFTDLVTTNGSTIEGTGEIFGLVVRNEGVIHALHAGNRQLVFQDAYTTNGGLIDVDSNASLLALGDIISSTTGLVTVGSNGSLDVFAGFALYNGATYKAATTNGMENGALTADWVTLGMDSGEEGGKCLLSANMSLEVAGPVRSKDKPCDLRDCLGSRLTMRGQSTLQAQSAEFSAGGGSLTPANFDVGDSATAHIAGDCTISTNGAWQTIGDGLCLIDGALHLGGAVKVAITSTLPVVLAGDLDNRATIADRFDWQAGALTLNGRPATQYFEVAGRDVGTDTNGFANNFAMGRVEIAGGTSVTFRDVFDNDGLGQSACGEALYVDTLVLRSGSAITLNNCRIYFNQLINEGGTISVIGGCGVPQATLFGDFDHDRDVDLADYAAFIGCLGGPGVQAGVSCAAFDMNGDGDVDLVEAAAFMKGFGGS